MFVSLQEKNIQIVHVTYFDKLQKRVQCIVNMMELPFWRNINRYTSSFMFPTGIIRKNKCFALIDKTWEHLRLRWTRFHMVLCDERSFPTVRRAFSFLIERTLIVQKQKSVLVFCTSDERAVGTQRGAPHRICTSDKRAVGTQRWAPNRIRFGVQVVFTPHK